MAFAINKGMEKLGGHFLQFGYLPCHVASGWWMVEDEGFGVWTGGDMEPIHCTEFSLGMYFYAWKSEAEGNNNKRRNIVLLLLLAMLRTTFFKTLT